MNTPKLRAIALTAIVAALSGTARAEFFTPPAPGQVGVSFSAENTGSGDGTLESNGTRFKKVDISSLTLAAAKTHRISDGQFVSLGINYEYIDVYQEHHHHRGDRRTRYYEEAPVPLPEDLQTLGASLSYIDVVNDHWTFFSSVGVESRVAERNLGSEGRGVQAIAMGIYKYSPTLSLAFGAAYDSYSEDWNFVPFFGFDWRVAPKWVVAVGFPKTGVTYEFRDDLSFSLEVSGAGGTYYVEKDPLPGASPRSLADSKLEYTEVRLGFGVNWKINETFSISGNAGHVLYREFDYVKRNTALKSRGVAPFLSVAGNIRL